MFNLTLRKFILQLICMLIFSSCQQVVNCDELIASFDEEKDLPVLNEELRKHNSDIDDLEDRVTTIEGGGSAYLSSSVSSFAVKKLADQSNIAVGGAVKVTWDTETFDTGSDFDTAINNGFVAPQDGIYVICANITLEDADSAGDYQMFISAGANAYYVFTDGSTMAGDGTIHFSESVIVSLDKNDVVTVYVQQTGGAQQTDIAGVNDSNFSGSLI